MNQLLQKAFERAAELPEAEQDRFALFLLAELESERQWAELFARPESEDLLESLADEAPQTNVALPQTYPPGFTNEGQHQLKVLPWELNTANVPLKSGVKRPRQSPSLPRIRPFIRPPLPVHFTVLPVGPFCHSLSPLQSISHLCKTSPFLC